MNVFRRSMMEACKLFRAGRAHVGLVSIPVKREGTSVKFATAPLRLGNGALRLESLSVKCATAPLECERPPLNP